MKTVLLNPYCTLQDVQRETQNNDEEDADDIRAAINLASRYVDAQTNRDFFYHDHSSAPMHVPESWCAGNVIFFPWPVIELSKVEIEESDGTKTELQASDYRVDTNPTAQTCQIVRNGRWYPLPCRTRAGLASAQVLAIGPRVLLTGKFGFAPQMTTGNSPAVDTSKPSLSLPGDLVVACTVIAAVRSGKYRKESLSADGNKTSTVMKTIPADTLRILARYRRPVV